MALDELFQAMNMFKQGVTEYATAQGINKAHDEVLQLKSQQLDEVKERQGLSSIANNLTMHLASIGAPLGQMQAAVGAVSPPAIKDAQDAYMQGLLAGPDKGAGLMKLGQTGQTYDAAPKKELANIEGQYKLAAARIGADALVGRNASKETTTNNKAARDEMNRFEGRADVKNLRQNLDAVGKIDTLLQDNSPTGQQLSKLALIRLAQGSGIISDQDAKLAEGDPSLAADVMRTVSRKVLGEPFKEDVKLYKRLSSGLMGAANDRLRQKATSFAKSRSKYLGGTTPNEFTTTLLNGIEATDTQSATSTGPAAPMAGPAVSNGNALPPGLPAGSMLTTVKDKSGNTMQVYKTPDGKFFKAD